MYFVKIVRQKAIIKDNKFRTELCRFFKSTELGMKVNKLQFLKLKIE